MEVFVKALTQEQADAKLAAWLEAKTAVDAKKDGLSKRKLMLKQKLSKLSKKLMLNV
jgi:small subunit ribosomal protein S16